MSFHFQIEQGQKNHNRVPVSSSNRVDTGGISVRQMELPRVEEMPDMFDEDIEGMEDFANDEKLQPAFADDDFDEPMPQAQAQQQQRRPPLVEEFPEEEEEYEEYEEEGDVMMEEDRLSPNEIRHEKLQIENQFIRLKNKGIAVPEFSMSEDLESLRYKLKTVMSRVGSASTVALMKQGIVLSTAGVENVNRNLLKNPFDLTLDGWGESVRMDVESEEYDDVLEELYYKHQDKLTVSPEVKLIGMLAMSGYKFHMNNHMAREMAKAAAPQYMQDNPEMMKAMQFEAQRQLMKKSLSGQSPEEDIEAIIRNGTAKFKV